MDAMSCVLRRATRSSFSNEIKCVQKLRIFSRPPFILYDGKAKLIEHVSH